MSNQPPISFRPNQQPTVPQQYVSNMHAFMPGAYGAGNFPGANTFGMGAGSNFNQPSAFNQLPPAFPQSETNNAGRHQTFFMRNVGNVSQAMSNQHVAHLRAV